MSWTALSLAVSSSHRWCGWVASYCRRHVRWLRVIVHPVVMPGGWGVVVDGARQRGSVVEPVASYLAYLAALERSPNTQRAYAMSLKLWFEFVDRVGLVWDAVRVDDVARFVSWLRSPADNVIVFDAGTAPAVGGHGEPACSAPVFGFYEHHARHGVKVTSELVVWRHLGPAPGPLPLHHVSGGRPIATRPVKLRVAKRTPRTLSAEQFGHRVGVADASP